MSEEIVPDVTEEGSYDGARENGLRHGFGTCHFPSGARYTGNWEKGLKHGEGTFIYPDGSRYEGEWWEDKKHGHGRYIYPNGDIYDGMWRMDIKNGLGHYVQGKNGFHYKGNFKDGAMDGSAQVAVNNVLFYGEFVDGKPVGEGRYVLPNGLQVNGEYKLHGEMKIPLWITKGVDKAEEMEADQSGNFNLDIDKSANNSNVESGKNLNADGSDNLDADIAEDMKVDQSGNFNLGVDKSSNTNVESENLHADGSDNLDVDISENIDIKKSKNITVDKSNEIEEE